MAIYANISIDQGSDFYSIVEVEQTDGALFDLSDYTARGQIRKTYSSTTYTDFSAVISDGPRGRVAISLTATQTSALKAGRYVYDIEVISNGGAVTRIVEGQVEVNPSVTRTA